MGNNTPLWVIVFLLAFGIGWYIQKDMASWPTKSERALDNHNELMQSLRNKGIIK